MAFVLGGYIEGVHLKTRFRPSDELRSTYTVRIGTLQPNCLAIPFEIVDLRPEPELPLDDKLVKVTQGIHRTFEVMSQRNLAALHEVIQDTGWRDRLIRASLKAAPQAGEGWRLGIRVFERDEVSIGHDDISEYEVMRAVRDEDAAKMTVTGKLIRADFEGQQLWIKHPQTNKEIECNYLAEIEEQLLDARRDYIQVTGEFTLDHDGFPMRLSEVSLVEPLDLSVMTVDRVVIGDMNLRIAPPLKIRPALDEESKQLLIAEDVDLGVSVYAYTRHQLLREVEECLVFLWTNFVEDESDPLSGDAQSLRDRLRDRITRGG
ncbi:hypothetical protein JW859_06635 [bacterium]|nr:hypothetical protein [bacterium]